MRAVYYLFLLLIIFLYSVPLSAESSLSGTKGQNYDRIVFDNPTDDEVGIVAKIMTINRFADSSSSIVIKDNGQTVFGPQTDSVERWKRQISVKGKGRHELVMICTNSNAEAVYCTLDVDNTKVSMKN